MNIFCQHDYQVGQYTGVAGRNYGIMYTGVKTHCVKCDKELHVNDVSELPNNIPMLFPVEGIDYE